MQKSNRRNWNSRQTREMRNFLEIICGFSLRRNANSISTDIMKWDLYARKRAVGFAAKCDLCETLWWGKRAIWVWCAWKCASHLIKRSIFYGRSRFWLFWLIISMANCWLNIPLKAFYWWPLLRLLAADVNESRKDDFFVSELTLDSAFFSLLASLGMFEKFH